MSGLFGDEPEDEPPPPPPEGPGLFGDAPAAPIPEPIHATPYRVLARKYRPTTFDDLIGQESMVRILRNAFAAGRGAGPQFHEFGGIAGQIAVRSHRRGACARGE